MWNVPKSELRETKITDSTSGTEYEASSKHRVCQIRGNWMHNKQHI